MCLHGLPSPERYAGVIAEGCTVSMAGTYDGLQTSLCVSSNFIVDPGLRREDGYCYSTPLATALPPIPLQIWPAEEAAGAQDEEGAEEHEDGGFAMLDRDQRCPDQLDEADQHRAAKGSGQRAQPA